MLVPGTGASSFPDTNIPLQFTQSLSISSRDFSIISQFQPLSQGQFSTAITGKIPHLIQRPRILVTQLKASISAAYHNSSILVQFQYPIFHHLL